MSEGSFEVEEGNPAFAPGSSGWTVEGRETAWIELFLRGGSAWEEFGCSLMDSRIEIEVGG